MALPRPLARDRSINRARRRRRRLLGRLVPHRRDQQGDRGSPEAVGGRPRSLPPGLRRRGGRRGFEKRQLGAEGGGEGSAGGVFGGDGGRVCRRGGGRRLRGEEGGVEEGGERERDESGREKRDEDAFFLFFSRFQFLVASPRFSPFLAAQLWVADVKKRQTDLDYEH